MTVTCKLAPKSNYEQLVTKRKEYRGSFAPPFDAATDAGWAELLNALADAPARQKALRDTIDTIHAHDKWTKVIVFAPVGPPFDSARAALMKLGRPVLIAEAAAEAAANGASVGEDLDTFSQPDLRDQSKPLVLLMSFDQSSALNLQKVSHNVIFYAPLWGTPVTARTRLSTRARSWRPAYLSVAGVDRAPTRSPCRPCMSSSSQHARSRRPMFLVSRDHSYVTDHCAVWPQGRMRMVCMPPPTSSKPSAE